MSKVSKSFTPTFSNSIYSDYNIPERLKNQIEDCDDPATALVLLIRENSDSEAMETLCKLCENQVRITAIKLISKNDRLRTSFEDMVQEGFLGILNAVEKFDTSFGVKFTTYSQYWVTKRIYDFCFLRNKPNANDCEFDELENNPPKSFITTYENKVIDFVDNERLRDLMPEILSSDILTLREKDVLKSTFGLLNEKRIPQVEIAENLGVTRQSINNTIRKSLRKIKTYYGTRLLPFAS